MGLNFSFPCMAAICALSCLLRILTKSESPTVTVILGSPAAPAVTHPEGFVRSSVQVPPVSPVMTKWMTALISLASSGFAVSAAGMSFSRMLLAVASAMGRLRGE